MGELTDRYRVFLNMTNERALEQVQLDDLKKFALDKEVNWNNGVTNGINGASGAGEDKGQANST
jgi:hypothetical protein